MEILVKDIVEQCDYTYSSFCKVLTKHGISNHFILNQIDLEKLHDNLEVKNRYSFSLKQALQEVLNKSA